MWDKIVVNFTRKASIAGLAREMLFATALICSQINISGHECVVTSGTDGVHGYRSRHYTGEAIDLRTRDMTWREKRAIVDNLKRKLGDNFDVVLESTHLHVEYHPKEEKDGKVRRNSR